MLYSKIQRTEPANELLLSSQGATGEGEAAACLSLWRLFPAQEFLEIGHAGPDQITGRTFAERGIAAR